MKLGSTDFTSERGRGMIEVIAVLILVGVLTMADLGTLSTNDKTTEHVGSPNTVSYALDKTKAIDLSNELNERLISYRMQWAMGNRTLVDEQGPRTRTGYPLKLTSAGGDKFSVTVSGISGGICIQMLMIQAVSALQITVNGAAFHGDVNVCKKTNNTLSYTFDAAGY